MQDSYLARYNLTKFLFPALILVFLLISFWAAFHKMSIRWDSGDSNYCYLVIPLFAYLLWDKRKKEAQGSRLKVQSGEDRRLEDQKLGRLEGEKVEGFRFGEFSWSIYGLIPIVFSIILINVQPVLRKHGVA